MKQNRRDCCQVITQMLEKIPVTEEVFIKDLQWNYEDASFKAPKENTQWIKTHQTLFKHIPVPKKDWEFEVLSIFSTMTIDEIKDAVKKDERNKKLIKEINITANLIN